MPNAFDKEIQLEEIKAKNFANLMFLTENALCLNQEKINHEKVQMHTKV